MAWDDWISLGDRGAFLTALDGGSLEDLGEGNDALAICRALDLAAQLGGLVVDGDVIVEFEVEGQDLVMTARSTPNEPKRRWTRAPDDLIPDERDELGEQDVLWEVVKRAVSVMQSGPTDED